MSWTEEQERLQIEAHRALVRTRLIFAISLIVFAVTIIVAAS